MCLVEKIPVSYEVARKQLDEAQTREEIDEAIAACVQAMTRDWDWSGGPLPEVE